MSSRPRIVLDCDPGVDDAVAIAVASAHTELVGITTVAGNVSLDHTTRNAILVCDLIGRTDVPIHAGCTQPIAGERLGDAAHVHGGDGLGLPHVAEPSRSPTSFDAVTWLIETVLEERDVWIVATGPLTNIASALERAPEIAAHIPGIAWMGGSTRHGDITAAAEFNAWADPEAASRVFDARIRNLAMIGLNVTEHVLVTPEWVQSLGSVLEGRPDAPLASMLSHYSDYHLDQTTLGGTPIHDALAVLAVTHGDLFWFADRFVSILTGPTAVRGMTLVDQRPRPRIHRFNARVAEKVDANRLRRLIWDAVVSGNTGLG